MSNFHPHHQSFSIYEQNLLFPAEYNIVTLTEWWLCTSLFQLTCELWEDDVDQGKEDDIHGLSFHPPFSGLWQHFYFFHTRKCKSSSYPSCDTIRHMIYLPSSLAIFLSSIRIRGKNILRQMSRENREREWRWKMRSKKVFDLFHHPFNWHKKHAHTSKS